MNKNKKEEIKKVVVDFINKNKLSMYEYKSQNNFAFSIETIKKYKLKANETAENKLLYIESEVDSLSLINDLINKNKDDIEKRLILNSLHSAQLLMSLLEQVDLKTIKQISFLGNTEYFLWDNIYKDWTMITHYINSLIGNKENLHLIKIVLSKYNAAVSNYNVKILINIFKSLKKDLTYSEFDNLFFHWCTSHKIYILQKNEVLSYLLTFIEKSFTETKKYKKLFNIDDNIFDNDITKIPNELKIELKQSIYIDININELYKKYQISFEKVQKRNYSLLLMQFLKDFKKSDLIQKMNIDICSDYRQPNNLIIMIYAKDKEKLIKNNMLYLVDLFLNEVLKNYKDESMLFSLDIKKTKKLIEMNKSIMKKLEIIYNHESTKLSLINVQKEKPKSVKKI